MQSVKPYVSLNTLKMIYCSCFHAIMTYGWMYCRHSSDSIKISVFKRRLLESWFFVEAVTLVDNCFFYLEILPLPYQYILSLLFMIRNRNHFLVNSEIDQMDTRLHANFHQPSVNLTKCQKGVYCMVIRCLVLSLYIKIESDNPK